MRTQRLDPSQTAEYRVAMTLIVGACTLAALGSVIPAVEHTVNVGMAGLLALVVLVAVLRRLVRFVRERLEDAEPGHGDVGRVLHDRDDRAERGQGAGADDDGHGGPVLRGRSGVEASSGHQARTATGAVPSSSWSSSWA